MRKILLLSNSTNYGETFLAYPKEAIKAFLGPRRLKLAFVPYAGVTLDWDKYTRMVTERMAAMGHETTPVHSVADPSAVIRSADAVVVGGGNTFHLLNELYRYDLLDLIRAEVDRGKPYIGWSAGSNVACPTIATTNDMPIVEPPSLKALGLVPFQLNPHYLDTHPDGHKGETREDRINEYIKINRDKYVIGLREGTLLRIAGNDMTLVGHRTMRLFRYGLTPRELTATDDLRFLLDNTG
ncbi:MAG: dipeptidase PepE [Candidatus Neomarinimicrobiota bacterium]